MSDKKDFKPGDIMILVVDQGGAQAPKSEAQRIAVSMLDQLYKEKRKLEDSGARAAVNLCVALYDMGASRQEAEAAIAEVFMAYRFAITGLVSSN